MLSDNCLEGVDEVYGCHNWPTREVGKLMIKPGPVMAEVTVVVITFKSK